MKERGNAESGVPVKRKRRGLWIVGGVLCVLAILVAAYAIWERPPEISNDPTAKPLPTVVPDKLQPSGNSTSPEVKTPENENPDKIEEVDPNALVTDRAPGTYTFLLVGRDFMSNSTDTIIVGRLDTKKNTINCVSIPRDTLININWSNTPKKINAVYPGYINSGKDGVEGLRLQLTNLMGFDADCFAVVSMKAVEEVVDAIGGVWFDVPQDMDYEAPDQDLHIHIKAGYQLLNGEDMVKVCRFREGYAGGDIDRINVQQAILKALASQMLSLGNIPNLGTVVDILVDNTDTDLTAANIAWFARQFLLCSMDNIHFQTMPYSTGCVINGISFVSVDVDNWLAMVNERLNPYVDPVLTENVNILCSNYDGTRMWSTTGVINGGEDSFYCPSCTVKNDGKAVHHLPGMCP